MITFGKFAKEYNVPRASVYAIMSDLEKDDINVYKQCVDMSNGTKMLTDTGVNYILKMRGLDVQETVNDNVNTDFKQSTDNDVLQAVEILKNELDTRNKQFDELQKNYSKLAESLAELTRNQQLLTRHLQDSNMYIDSPKHSHDKSVDVQDSADTDKYNSSTTKKSFWSKLFGN